MLTNVMTRGIATSTQLARTPTAASNVLAMMDTLVTEGIAQVCVNRRALNKGERLHS